MYKNNSIAVVVPCYNEAQQISKVVKTMPEYVDHILIIDDASSDNTCDIVSGLNDDKISLIKHSKNQGVGGAIATGYKWSRDQNINIAVVMAGDGQMDPNDFESIITPIIDDSADYVKGNRLLYGDAYNKIPKIRFLEIQYYLY